MIIARIKGGLGNQLFAYAAARRLSIINRDELVLDHLSGFRRDYKFNRNFQLNYFNIPCELVGEYKGFNFFQLAFTKVKKIINKFTRFETRSYIEQEFDDFDERLLKIRTNKRDSLILDGLWQSQLYFLDVEKTIRKELKFNIELNGSGKKLLNHLKNNQSVCIHIRKFGPSGDTRNVPGRYYEQAINKIKSKLNNPKFYLFTDDVEYSRSLLSNCDVEFFDVSKSKYHSAFDVAELYLMTQCKHHIIANSTFSWWGAWLAENKNQKVIYPIEQSADIWCWNYNGQMPSAWEPITVKNEDYKWTL